VFVGHPLRVPADRVALARDGYAGIVVDPGGYIDEATWAQVRDSLLVLGAPTRLGPLWVWPLPEAPGEPTP
jgi:hypothetical protein